MFGMKRKTKKKYRVLCADPPWAFGDKLPGDSRGAEKNYRVLTLDDIKAFPLPDLEDDCILFLWRVSAMQEEALAVVRAWGFVPKTEIVWKKKTKHGKRWFGMGRYCRAEHESCIIAVRGKMPPKVKNVRSTFSAPIGIHSEKPEAFYKIVEKMYDGPYVELFGRRLRDGWKVLGDQAPKETKRRAA